MLFSSLMQMLTYQRSYRFFLFFFFCKNCKKRSSSKNFQIIFQNLSLVLSVYVIFFMYIYWKHFICNINNVGLTTRIFLMGGAFLGWPLSYSFFFSLTKCLMQLFWHYLEQGYGRVSIDEDWLGDRTVKILLYASFFSTSTWYSNIHSPRNLSKAWQYFLQHVMWCAFLKCFKGYRGSYHKLSKFQAFQIFFPHKLL